MKLNLAIATVALSLLGAAANAQLTFSVAPDPTATPDAGFDTVFLGTIVNNTNTTIVVDGTSLTTDVNGFDYQLDIVTSQLPYTFNPGDSLSADVFELATGSGPYSYTYQLTSGTAPAVVGVVTNVPTSAVPEPGSLALLASGLVGGSLFAARRRK